MKTRFPIILQIDDNSYEVVYSLPTKAQQKTLSELGTEDETAIENYVKQSKQLELLESTRANNTLLIPELKGDERKEVLLEQRSLLKQIEKLMPEVEKAAKVKLTDKAAEKRFELLVSGDDKVQLEADAKAKDISISKLMQEIFLGVSKAKEKK